MTLRRASQINGGSAFVPHLVQQGVSCAPGPDQDELIPAKRCLVCLPVHLFVVDITQSQPAFSTRRKFVFSAPHLEASLHPSAHCTSGLLLAWAQYQPHPP